MAYWGSRDAKPSPNFFDSLELHVQPDIPITTHNVQTARVSAFPGAEAILYSNPDDSFPHPVAIRPANTLRIRIPETTNILPLEHSPLIHTSASRFTRFPRNGQPTLP